MSLSILYLSIVVLALPVIYAEATLNNVVGVELSKSCITMIKNNISSTCPTYEQLLELDTSKTEWVGEFEVTNGFFHRGPSIMTNPWIVYEDSEEDHIVVIDPPKGMHQRINLITIQPNFDTYIDKSDSQITDYNRIVYHHRYTNPGCDKATINADMWTELVADTIFFMRNECDSKFTSFNHTEVIPIQLTKHDISTSYKYQLDKWIQEVKTHCLFKFKACQ